MVEKRAKGVETGLFALRVGLVAAGIVLAVALAEAELGIACAIAAVKLASELPIATPRRRTAF